MEVMAGEVDAFDLGVGHLYASSIGVLIELATNLEARTGRRGSDKLDDGLVTHQRLAAPILSDERKQAMFYFIPLVAGGK